MNAKLLLGLVVVAIAGYFAYLQYGQDGGKGAGGPNDEVAVRASVGNLSKALANNNFKAASSMVAPGFSDKTMKRAEFLKVLKIKRKGYKGQIKFVRVDKDIASVSYQRTETRGGVEPIQVEVKNETWIRDKVDRQSWRLYKLAANDEWFRNLDPIGPGAVKVATKQDAGPTVIERLRKDDGVKPMKPGERYSPVGKRDPFQSLIGPKTATIIGDEMCQSDRPREFLENFDLRSLKLSGVIIKGQNESVALIEIPDGKGYSVRMGMYMGKNCGHVLEIWNDYMLVKEQVHKPGTPPGSYEEIETIVKLRPEEG